MAKLGHDTKLIPAQHVTPFVRGNKHDHTRMTIIVRFDAFAITQKRARERIFVLCRLNQSISKKYPVYTVYVNVQSKIKQPSIIKYVDY